MLHDDFDQIRSFLMQYGLLNLVTNSSVQSIVVWKNVHPKISEQGVEETMNDSYINQRRWFLLVVGCKHDLLAALLVSGECTTK